MPVQRHLFGVPDRRATVRGRGVVVPDGLRLPGVRLHFGLSNRIGPHSVFHWVRAVRNIGTAGRNGGGLAVVVGRQFLRCDDVFVIVPSDWCVRILAICGRVLPTRGLDLSIFAGDAGQRAGRHYANGGRWFQIAAPLKSNLSIASCII